MPGKTWVDRETIDKAELDNIEYAVGFNVRTYGAKGDGTTNDATAINNAISAANTAGGGVVTFGEGTFAITSTITLKDNVVLQLRGGTVKWTGSSGGTMFTSGSLSPLTRAGVVGGRVNPNLGGNAASFVFVLHSPQHCRFTDIMCESASATCTFIYVDTLVTNGNAYDGTKNAIWNEFRHLTTAGSMGTYMSLRGQSGAPLTGNTFHNCQGHDVRVIGIDCVEWVDSNSFTGYTYFNVNANNGIGVRMNGTATPTVEAQVYSNNFDDLAVNLISVFTGRKALVLNYSHWTVIRQYFQDPISAGEPAIDITNIGSDGSYFLMSARTNDSRLTNTVHGEIHSKNMVNVDHIIMAGGKGIVWANTGQLIIPAAGTPEGVITAPKGSLYLRSDGGAGTTLYVKETGAGNTGWVGK